MRRERVNAAADAHRGTVLHDGTIGGRLLPLGLGAAGWILLGGIFVVAGLALLPIVAWAERTRADFATEAPRPKAGMSTVQR